ncbi:Steroid 5-alpha-reductase det2 [Quaeritorhiza haematococci]|nr:Steroid 5-alpha-reductase det2 [Quaeritorhiza haematococci]
MVTFLGGFTHLLWPPTPTSKPTLNTTTLILLSYYIGHYINRAWIYTYRVPKMSSCAFLVFASAIIFNIANGYVQGIVLGADFGGRFGDDGSWLKDPRFIIGSFIFFIGMYINITGDNSLMRQRAEKLRQLASSNNKKETTDPTDKKNTYVIPRGGLFEYISNPHYFGECIQWLGWGIATWSEPGFTFAVYTWSNIATRALTSHRWYKKTFGDAYPKNRKAIIPFLI